MKLKAKLAAGTAVYLASPQARFLSGRYMSANWDVNELEARKSEIMKKNLLTVDLKGEFGSAVKTTPIYVTILYSAEEGVFFDIDYLVNTHMPLAMKEWKRYGLLSWEITQFDMTNNPKSKYAAQLIQKWDDLEGMEEAIKSPEGKIV
jgi:hypothetical protein